MTREEKIELLNRLLEVEEKNDIGNLTRAERREFQQWVEALEQEPCEDAMAIHTQGLDEGIRCAMCTNSMKSNRGCDGGCAVNEGMYKEVINTIGNHIVPPVTPTRKVGKWIYDKKIQNWRCSACKEIPRTPGYVGTADFMAEHFRFCNHCGAEMKA
jgi:hypothetical protein